MEDEKKNKKVLANVKSPIINAIIHQRYAFSDKQDVLNKINAIAQRFVKSTLTESVDPDCTVLWIRDYNLTNEDIKAGCVGNYALLYPDVTPDGKFTVTARKLTIEPARHPQRKRTKSKHPDWGYWVLRRVKKNWRYGSIDEAYNDLMQLAEDFPEVSIPGQNKLYTIIYRKTTDESLPLFRVVLEVEFSPEGGFIISCTENTYKCKDKVEAEQESEEQPEQMGKFAAMVSVKRNKRKNIADVTKRNEKASDPVSE